MPDAEIATLFISEAGLQIPDHPLTAVGGLVGRAGLLLEGQPLVCDLAERLGRPLDHLLSPSHRYRVLALLDEPTGRDMEFPCPLEADGRIAAQRHETLRPIQPELISPELGTFSRDQQEEAASIGQLLVLRFGLALKIARSETLSGISFRPPRLDDHPILHRITFGFGGILRGNLGGHKVPTPSATPNHSGLRRTAMEALEQNRTAKILDISRAYQQDLLDFGVFCEAWKQPDGSPGWIRTSDHPINSRMLYR